ncbi:DUF2917 domain-containing protein [Simplicispira suum]|uniref:DUF2917 domain-containing protein n=1 Tax=Simplicispira suum TaxID=2109915 RepID=A0A2S0N0M1_9BURK|nr:DUF2917 domain-containing protein [Simplicispira suum]AVO41685.1 hypothetical protein C6571_10680 [Simplicispira suum]MBW7834897.1 DUF2917 domain-containing protein [Simplicispira suum]
MSSAPPPSLFAARDLPRLPGAAALQRLPPGGVITLLARRAQVLRIDSGCAWVTLGRGPVDGMGRADMRAGDTFVHAGQLLRVPAGTRAVIEAARGMELRFVWQAADATARQLRRRRGAGACEAQDAAACC